MFGGLQGFVPDSDEPEGDDFQVVYGDAREEAAAAGHAEDAPAARAGRLRYGAAYAGTALVSQRAAGGAAASGLRQHPAGSLAASGGHGAVADPGSPVLSGRQPQEPPLTLAQQIQTVLHGMTQQPQAGAAGPPPAAQQPQAAQQQQAAPEQPLQRQRRHSGQIKHSSPAVPPPGMLPAAGGPPSGSGGRRWRQAQAAAAAQRQQQSPAVPPDGGGSSFFAVDDDLVQAAQRQAAQQQQQQAGRQRQRRPARTVQWDSPQAPAAAPLSSQQPSGAEQTPVQSQRANPLAALLHGGGSSSAAKPRPATTGSKPRGRHPIYGQAPASAAPAPLASQASTRDGSSTGGAAASSSRQLREALGLRDPPLTSPRQLQQARRQPQHQHSRFAIREPAQVAAEEAAASQQAGTDAVGAAGAAPAAAGLRLLTGGEPASAHKEQFQPRPRRAPTPSDQIVDEDEEGSMNGWPRAQRQPAAPQPPPQQQQPGAAFQGAAGDDAFRTPGQRLRSGRPDSSAAEAAAAAVAAAAGAAPDSSGHPGAPGSSGGKGALSLQRQFIAQLQPVSRPAAAATMQQQRQRLAGAAGLHARLQAILVAEKAGLDAQSPAGGAAAAAAPRLMVLQKELEGSITKCLCRCDGAAQAALGAPEVVALLQKATAREVDTAPGCTLLLRQPWRIIHLPGSQKPVVLCYSAAMG